MIPIPLSTSREWSSFSVVPERATRFDTLAVRKWRGNVTIRAIRGLYSWTDSADIKAALDAAIATIFEKSLDEISPDLSEYVSVSYDGFVIGKAAVIYSLRLAAGDSVDTAFIPGFTTDRKAYTTLRSSSGYGLIHRVPWPGAELMPSWYVIAQRSFYSSSTSRSYNLRTMRGYFHAGHSIYLDRATEFPIEGLTQIDIGFSQQVRLGEIIEIPFPSPDTYGYPSLATDDPYMVGKTSIYQTTNGVVNLLRSYHEGVDPYTDMSV